MRVEGRLAQRSMLSPSPPGGTLAGNEGALAAWAEAMAEEWSDSGYLFKAVEDSRLGVTRARFRISGFLTDSGGMPAAEYQRQLAAAESWRQRMAPAVATPVQTTQLEVTYRVGARAAARVRRGRLQR